MHSDRCQLCMHKIMLAPKIARCGSTQDTEDVKPTPLPKTPTMPPLPSISRRKHYRTVTHTKHPLPARTKINTPRSPAPPPNPPRPSSSPPPGASTSTSAPTPPLNPPPPPIPKHSTATSNGPSQVPRPQSPARDEQSQHGTIRSIH